jgi:hypothetical protein
MPETVDEHEEALRNERGQVAAQALIEFLKQVGNLTSAHGEICFHLDDGMNMQMPFQFGKEHPHA